MNLSMAIGMDQDAVLCGVCAAQRFVHDVVIMPPRDVRDGLGADGADASLFFPEVQEPVVLRCDQICFTIHEQFSR